MAGGGADAVADRSGRGRGGGVAQPRRARAGGRLVQSHALGNPSQPRGPRRVGPLLHTFFCWLPYSSGKLLLIHPKLKSQQGTFREERQPLGKGFLAQPLGNPGPRQDHTSLPLGCIFLNTSCTEICLIYNKVHTLKHTIS